MDETIPLLLMAAVAIVTVRWFMAANNQEDQMNIHQLEEEVARLQAMFPALPNAVIRMERSRVSSFNESIDRLLQLADRPPSPTTIPSSKASPNNAPNFLNIEVDQVDKSVWEADGQLRQALLRSRKDAMIKAARERLLSKNDY